MSSVSGSEPGGGPIGGGAYAGISRSRNSSPSLGCVAGKKGTTLAPAVFGYTATTALGSTTAVSDGMRPSTSIVTSAPLTGKHSLNSPNVTPIWVSNSSFQLPSSTLTTCRPATHSATCASGPSRDFNASSSIVTACCAYIRKVRFRRSSVTPSIVGTACNQLTCEFLPMTSKQPGKSGNLIWAIFFVSGSGRLDLKENSLVAPRDKDPMWGSGPSPKSESVCHWMLEVPSR
mmetsp:Transcript_55614/g.121820  ORF Transcript_55614/g.121820 Transcript_55614/m.121820 type:complete len:232 (+) Transcript_55614:1304-1999(+)